MKDEWKSIETAPKDRQILLWWPFWEEAIKGYWDTEKFHSKPKPHWNSHRMPFAGKRNIRENQPTHWRENIEGPTQ